MNKVKIAYEKGYRVDKEGNPSSSFGPLKYCLNKKGYKIIGVKIEGLAKNVFVHRLQAFQKYGDDMFEKGIQVRHKNGISTDNSWDNILIGTASENRMDIPAHIRLSSAMRASSFIKKHDHEKVISYHMTNGNSYKKTMLEFNIPSKGSLHWILNKGIATIDRYIKKNDR